MRFRCLAALFAIALAAWPAAAQEQRGSIEGIVKDASGGVLPGVTVTVSSGSGIKLDTVSDSEGVYRFPSLAPGVYSVTANLQGFKSGSVESIQVGLGQIKKADFALSVAGVTETVQVTAETPLVDVKQSSRQTNIRAEQVSLLPHGRDFTSLVTQAPGANNEPKSNGIMIDGATASENRYVIDGIETTDLVHGTSGKNVIADFVEEVQVKSSGYNAEYGGSTGGVINVITKSGTNNLSGNALLYFQGSSLQGDPNKTLRLGLADTTKSEYQQYAKDDNTRFEPGGALGGPVLANRAWFFGAYQPAFTTIKRSVDASTSGNPNATVVSTTQKQRVQYLTANETMQLGSKLRTRVAFNNSWSESTGLLPALAGSDKPGTDYSKGTKFPNWSLSGTADYTVTPKFLLGARAGFYSADTHDFNVSTDTRYVFESSTNIGMAGVPADLQHASGFATIPTNNSIGRDALSRLMFQVDGTWYGQFAGSHQLRGGVQIDRRAEDILSGEQNNIVSLDWGQAFSGVSGPFGYYHVRSNGADPNTGFVTQGNIKSNLVGLFIQDAWTINNRLTVNAGLRTEQEKVPSYTTGEGIPAYPIQFGFADKLAPRLGFAYDIKGDGRTKAYGSWGIFYDIFKLELPQGSFGGQKWLEYYYTLDTPNFPTLDSDACPPACPGTLILGPVDFRQPSFGADSLEPNLKPMKSQELSFGVEHQVNNVLAATARYLHKQLDRGIEDTGSFDPVTHSETYIIANPGEGLTEFALNDTRLPKPKRDYDAVEFGLEKRAANNWFLRGSYTFSRLNGNYPGLSQTDENGRADPNVGRTYDYPLIMFKEDGTPNFGPLPTDRPHQVKVQSFYQFKFGTTIGANEYIASGLPVSREIGVIAGNNYPMQYLGRGSDGRTPVFSQLDFYVQHDLKFGGRTIQLQANVLNLFNQRTAINRFVTYNLNSGGALDFNQEDFYAGLLNFDQLIAQQNPTKDPRFLLNNGFQDPIQLRVGVKFIF